MPPLRVTVWNENVQEQRSLEIRTIYPDGIHGAIADAIRGEDVMVRCATFQEPEHGLSDEILADTDVLTWWGHKAHEEVEDEVVRRVTRRVWEGMGLIVLHSGHYSRVFRALMGTSCSLAWREAGEKERLWVCNPAHPIAAGIDRYFEIPASEMYGEPFAIPSPEEQIFISWFAGGEVFRSGCTWKRGAGKIFFFGPGHETHPIYHDANVRRVLRNAVRWAQPRGVPWIDRCPRVDPIEEL